MVNERVQWSSVGNDLHTGTGVPGAVISRTYQLDTSSVVFSGGKVARLIANGLLMYALVRYRNFCINFYVAKNI